MNPTIFPFIEQQKWTEIKIGEKNPADPQESWVSDYTYGGYLEDRTRVLGQFDPEMSKMLHLGVDYNLPAGTVVTVAHYMRVAHTLADDTKINGWGGRVIFEIGGCPQTLLMYGHLCPKLLPKVGAHFAPGDIVGVLAPMSENGGWFTHLHVQAIPRDYYEQFDNVNDLDGYVEDCENTMSVDPTMFITS